MIHVLYDHGDERPARDLTVPQLRAARLDAAGVLWVDLEAPTAQELASVLQDVFGLEPATAVLLLEHGGAAEPISLGTCVLVPIRSSAAWAPSPGRSRPQVSGTLGLYLGPNFLVSVHAEPWTLVAELREAVAAGTTSMSRGSAQLAAELLSLVARHDRTMADEAEAVLAGVEERHLDYPSVARLAQVRGLLADLHREVQQQRRVSLWLASSSATALATTDRAPFALLSQALGGQLERTSALLGVVTRLAESQRLHAQWQTARWLRIIALLLVTLWLAAGAWLVASAALGLGRR